jgi:hypothetical protein
MRFVFWLLLLLNVGALVYFNLDLIAPAPARELKSDINPEKLSLLTPEQVAAMPKRKTEQPAVRMVASDEPTACYEWGSFAPEKLGDATTIASTLSLNHQVVQQTSQQSVRYWVYKSPLASAEAAQAKAQELKALGIEDFFIVQEPKFRNAISFGVFRDEQLAIKLMDDLRRRGVREVVKSVRNQSEGNSSLMLTGVTKGLYEQLKKNLPDFPDTEIKDTLCSEG